MSENGGILSDHKLHKFIHMPIEELHALMAHQLPKNLAKSCMAIFLLQQKCAQLNRLQKHFIIQEKKRCREEAPSRVNKKASRW